MKNQLTAIAVLAAWSFVSSSARGQNVDDFLARTFTDSHQTQLPYRLYVPEGYDPSKSYPLIVFFHGAGEKGTDNVQHVENADVLRLLAPAVRAKYPAFMVAPQCPQGSRWVEMDWDEPSGTQPAEPSIPMHATLELLDALEDEYNIDKNRLYSTGLSMGGFGAWDLTIRSPGRFAALAAMAGGGDESTVGAIKTLPVWAFHGDDDNIISHHRSRNMVAALEAFGRTASRTGPTVTSDEVQGKTLVYTEYPGGGHTTSWVKGYKEALLPDWLFAQSLDGTLPGEGGGDMGGGDMGGGEMGGGEMGGGEMGGGEMGGGDMGGGDMGGGDMGGGDMGGGDTGGGDTGEASTTGAPSVANSPMIVRVGCAAAPGRGSSGAAEFLALFAAWRLAKRRESR